MERIIRDDGAEEQDERQHADRARRVESEWRQREAAKAGQDRGYEKERGPGARVAAEQQAVQNDDPGQNSDQAEDYMDLKHRRRLPYVRTAHFRPALGRRAASKRVEDIVTAIGRLGEACPPLGRSAASSNPGRTAAVSPQLSIRRRIWSGIVGEARNQNWIRTDAVVAASGRAMLSISVGLG
jgi:hypothetical protein